jgi:DNA-binding MarR family transcriptional regulator
MSKSEKPKETPDVAREAWVLLMQVMQAEKGKHIAALSSFELTFPQAQLLIRMDPLKHTPMNELAGQLFCDPSNVTGLVDKLETRGLIERRPSPEDRRVKMLAITKAGTALRTKLLDRFHTPPESIQDLSEADKKSLLAILKRASKTSG